MRGYLSLARLDPGCEEQRDAVALGSFAVLPGWCGDCRLLRVFRGRWAVLLFGEGAGEEVVVCWIVRWGCGTLGMLREE